MDIIVYVAIALMIVGFSVYAYKSGKELDKLNKEADEEDFTNRG